MDIIRDSKGRFVRGNQSQLGKKHTTETRAKLRLAWKTRSPVSEKTKKKISRALKGITPKNFKEAQKKAWATPRVGYKHSKETKQKIGKANKKALIGNIPWNKGKKYPSPWLDKYRFDKEFQKKLRILGAKASQNRKGYTSIEKVIYSFLKKKKIDFKPQKLINDKFLVDAYVPELNLIIECDGDYWHSLDKVKKRDKSKNAYLTKCGFNLIRLKESVIIDGSYERKLLKWLYLITP